MPGPKYGAHEFPSSFGFTGSATDRMTTTVKSHDRMKPTRKKKFAEGGGASSGRDLEALRRMKPEFRTDKENELVAREDAREKKATPAAPAGSGDRASLVDLVGGKARRRAEQELGLKKGGRAYADGGRVDTSLQGRADPSNALDQESGGLTPLRPGFRKGGMKKAMGGPVRAARGGATAIVKNAINKHVAAPKPRGHGVPPGKMCNN